MTDYKKMYLTLCRGANDCLDLLEGNETAEAARQVLQAAVLSAEEIYIDTCPEEE